MASELVGRDPEIAVVESLLASIGDGGGSLLVLGDPGIGKSALAAVAGQRAADRGMRVLACAGVPGEAHLSFAGLHQLLRPVLAEAGGLPRGQRDALLTALGAGDGVAPALLLVGLATLELLAAGAGRAPVLVVAEDVHWLDSSTCEVLAFVSRRLGADPMGLMGTAREAELEDNALARAGLAELRLGPLDPAAAAALLDARAVLDPVMRERVLEEAAGNPLALVELPLTASQHESRGAVNGRIPLTRRLEQAFASRLPGLPAVTRAALLAAALDDGDALAEVLAAASLVAGTPVSVADLGRWRRGSPRWTGRACGSGIRWCGRRWVRRPGRPGGRPCTGRWRRCWRVSRTARCGTGRRPAWGRTRRWPPDWRLPRAGPSAAGRSRNRRRRWPLRPGLARVRHGAGSGCSAPRRRFTNWAGCRRRCGCWMRLSRWT